MVIVLRIAKKYVRILKDNIEGCWAEGGKQSKTCFALSCLLSAADSVLGGHDAGGCSGHPAARERDTAATLRMGAVRTLVSFWVLPGATTLGLPIQ